MLKDFVYAILISFTQTHKTFQVKETDDLKITYMYICYIYILGLFSLTLDFKRQRELKLWPPKFFKPRKFRNTYNSKQIRQQLK